MEYILNNEQLTVTFTTKGGTICSIEDFMFEVNLIVVGEYYIFYSRFNLQLCV